MHQAALTVPSAALPDRTAWVDVARALCIILVVMMHSTLGLENAAGATGFLHPLVDFFAPIRIPTFFVISGLFMGQVVKRDLADFVRTRIMHLAYFYLLWLAIQIGARNVPVLTEAPHRLLGQFTLALVEPYGSLWFLHLLIMFSLLAYILRQVNPRVVLAAAALLYILRVQTGSVLLDEFSGRAIFFAAGWVLAPLFFASARWAIERHTCTTAFVLGLGLVNLAFIQLVDAEQIRLAGLVLGLAGAAAMAMLSAQLAGVPLVGKSMAALGRRSLSIYVAFTFPMAAFRALWVQADVLGDSWLGIGVGSVLITLVALAAPLVLEKAVRGSPLSFLFRRPDFTSDSAVGGSSTVGAPRSPRVSTLQPKRT